MGKYDHVKNGERGRPCPECKKPMLWLGIFGWQCDSTAPHEGEELSANKGKEDER